MRNSIGFMIPSFAILILALALALATLSSIGGQPPKGALDLADYLDMGFYYVKPPVATKDKKTGFIVGGKNDTTLIKGLKEINGKTIAELEKDMRPAAASKGGFLGADDSLLEVLAGDNRYVVEELNLTHQELAKHLHAMATIEQWQRKHNKKGAEFVYMGRRFKVNLEQPRGIQPSPFLDGTQSGTNATVNNLDNGKELQYALLLAFMIERYGFYEGKGTPYRVEPKVIVEFFDFLKAGKK